MCGLSKGIITRSKVYTGLKTNLAGRAAYTFLIPSALWGQQAFRELRDPVNSSVVKSRLEEIFKEEAYHKGLREISPPQGLVSFLQNVWERIVSFFQSLSMGMRELHFASPFLFWVVFSGLILLLLLLLLHIGWSIRVAFRRGSSAGQEESPEVRKRERAVKFLKQAEGEAEKQKYGEALRFLFLALVAALREKEALPSAASMTNHQIVRSIGIPRDRRFELARVADAFDNGWYGEKEVASDLFGSARRTVMSLLSDIKGGRVPCNQPGRDG